MSQQHRNQNANPPPRGSPAASASAGGGKGKGLAGAFEAQSGLGSQDEARRLSVTQAIAQNRVLSPASPLLLGNSDPSSAVGRADWYQICVIVLQISLKFRPCECAFMN